MWWSVCVPVYFCMCVWVSVCIASDKVTIVTKEKKSAGETDCWEGEKQWTINMHTHRHKYRPAYSLRRAVTAWLIMTSTSLYVNADCLNPVYSCCMSFTVGSWENNLQRFELSYISCLTRRKPLVHVKWDCPEGGFYSLNSNVAPETNFMSQPHTSWE